MRIDTVREATLINGDCVRVMNALPGQSIQTCITSPPYFGLRDYGHDGQIGLEQTPDDYVSKLVEVFRAVRRVLRDDGTVWLNLGDSYAGGGNGSRDPQRWPKQSRNDHMATHKKAGTGLAAKQLLMIPARVAIALQADGWYLRQDIIWAKPNPMPESVRDRCTKSHEYIFLLSKRAKYFYDHEAIKEPAQTHKGAELVNRNSGTGKARGLRGGADRQGNFKPSTDGLRNRRDVWNVATRPYKGAHFATFPPLLVEPCVLAGCPAGGVVLDPFSGSGTTGQVALQHGRSYIGIELNAEYQQLAIKRLIGA